MVEWKVSVVVSIFIVVLISGVSQPGPSTPAGWNEPYTLDRSAIMLFVNCSCPELVVTSVQYFVRLFVSVVQLKAENATHANIELQWSWFHLGGPPGYLSSEHQFTNLTVNQNCTLEEAFTVNAKAVGIFPGQLGSGYLMLSYRISYEVFNNTELLGGGGRDYAQDIPVIGGEDAAEVLTPWIAAVSLGSGLIIAVLAGIYFIKREK